VLSALLEEHAQSERLEAHGVTPTRSLLLSGPPGVGKTMAASYIAASLKLPLLRAEPSTIVTSLLGESARNLAAAFDAARRSPSVLLLDEFDAFAKRRDDSHEVGELKRFVTTLLVELERGLPHGVLIAATNHPELLDPAVHRRFDATIELGLPDLEARRMIFASSIDERDLAIAEGTLDLLAELTEGLSGSDLRRLLERALRAQLLSEEELDFALIRAAAEVDENAPREARARVARVAREGGLSTRAIGRLMGCSHTSVQRLLEAA